MSDFPLKKRSSLDREQVTWAVSSWTLSSWCSLDGELQCCLPCLLRLVVVSLWRFMWKLSIHIWQVRIWTIYSSCGSKFCAEKEGVGARWGRVWVSEKQFILPISILLFLGYPWISLYRLLDFLFLFFFFVHRIIGTISSSIPGASNLWTLVAVSHQMKVRDVVPLQEQTGGLISQILYSWNDSLVGSTRLFISFCAVFIVCFHVNTDGT